MKPAIEVTIAADGSISIDAIGFKGADCERATKYLEEALGSVARKDRKPEFHQRRTTSQNQKLGG